MPWINKAIDMSSVAAVASISAMVAETGNALNIDTTDFVNGVNNAMKRVFRNVSAGTLSDIQEMLNMVNDGSMGLPAFFKGLTLTSLEEIGIFETDSVKNVADAFIAIANVFQNGIGGLIDDVNVSIKTGWERMWNKIKKTGREAVQYTKNQFDLSQGAFSGGY